MKLPIILLIFGIYLANGLEIQQRFKRQGSQVHINSQRSRHPIDRITNTQTTPDGVPILAQSYASSRTAGTRQQSNTNSEPGLSLYQDFINDPWKPTQDLNSLIYERRPAVSTPRELRSGYQTSDPRDNIWYRSPTRPTERNNFRPDVRRWDSQPSGVRPIEPPYYSRPNTFDSAENDAWAISTRSGDHVTYVRRRGDGEKNNIVRGTSPRSEAWRGESPATSNRRMHGVPHGETGGRDWLVESRSDGHITYRRGSNKEHILARVVNTGDNSDERSELEYHKLRKVNNEPSNKDYKYKNQNYDQREDVPQGQYGWKPSLQLKSGDFVSYLGDDGTEIVFPRYRGADSSPQSSRMRIAVQPTRSTIRPISHYISTVQPGRFEQERDWRVSSKDDSRITWSRRGNEMEHSRDNDFTTTSRPYYYRDTTTRSSAYFHRSGMTNQIEFTTMRPYTYKITTQLPYTHRQTVTETRVPWHREHRSNVGGPHYPMLLEKETAERANRLGTSNALTLVY